MNKKQKNKIYATKDIVIAYITTINQDAYPSGKLTQSVLAFRQIRNKKQTTLQPIDTYFPYYSIEKTIPIAMKMKRTTPFISTHEIQVIIENEKYIQMQDRIKPILTEPVQPIISGDKQFSITEQFHFTSEKENNKVKKLIA